MHAFYSEQAALSFGTSFYLQDGKEVEATGIYQTKESGESKHIWPDSQYRGEVDCFSRPGKQVARFMKDTFMDLPSGPCYWDARSAC